MVLSTQPYITAVESSIITTGGRRNRAFYPKEFNIDIAEFFGYTLMTGTISKPSAELNFADCQFFPVMERRINEIYKQHWGFKDLRKNKLGFPRVCGKKNITFTILVFGNEKNLLPGHEKIPDFVWHSDEDVIRGFLKGLIGPCPKYMKYFGCWLAFRSPCLFTETKNLLQTHTTASFRADAGLLIYDMDELELLKKELDLEDASWWHSSTKLDLSTKVLK